MISYLFLVQESFSNTARVLLVLQVCELSGAEFSVVSSHRLAARVGRLKSFIYSATWGETQKHLEAVWQLQQCYGSVPELQFPWHGAKKNHLKRTVQQNSQCINTLQRAVGWEAWPWQTSFICPVICVQIHRHSLKPYPNYSHYYQKLLSEVPNRHRTAPFPSVVPARAQMQLQAKQAILNPILPVNFNLSTSVTMAGWSWLVHKWAQHWSAGKALLAAPQEPQPFLGSFGFFGFCLPSGYRFLASLLSQPVAVEGELVRI